ncbi:MAG: EAL domain-containing protein [Lachnospiraceae bacterium]|nr:EAL domain-containing protein [Lachnospiraceae bacterium]
MRIIYFDICAIVLSMTVLAFFISKRYTKGRNNRLIVMLSLLFLSASLLDTFNSLFGTYVSQSPANRSIQLITNSIFYVMRNLAVPAYILFLLSYFGVWYKLKKNSALLRCVYLPTCVIAVGVVINLFNGFMFYIDENGVYHRNNGLMLIYIVAFYYICIMGYLLFTYRHTVRSGELVMLSAFIPLNVIAVIVQRIFPGLRVEMLAISLTLFMIATAVQRPEEIVDAVVGTESMHAFFIDMYKSYSVGRPMNAVFIKIRNQRSLRNNLGIETYNRALRRVGSKLIQMGRIISISTDVYYNGRGVFAIISEAERYEQTLDLARLVTSYLNESFMLDNLEIKLNTKVCLARLPEDIGSYQALLRFNNTFHNVTPDTNTVIILSDICESREFKIKSEIDEIIKRGIEDNRFRMYYQPIYSVKEDSFVSAEALIRLEDEEYGFVSPGIFIPAAEASGAIHDIGDFVLEDVCRFIHRAEFLKSGLEYIEINLSVTQCIEPKLVEKIRGLISKYRVKTSQINLEITETAVDYDPVITDNNIYSLWNMGFSFSLDDYGTGYSNIKRVVSLPLDIIKFDKSFVDEMDDPKMWIAIVNTVDMLKQMNKKILVEGVEDKRTLDRFVELGCDYIQGFYFSKPLNQKDFIAFVNEHNSGKVYDR